MLLGAPAADFAHVGPLPALVRRLNWIRDPPHAGRAADLPRRGGLRLHHDGRLTVRVNWAKARTPARNLGVAQFLPSVFSLLHS